MIGRSGQVARSLVERCEARGGHELIVASRPDTDLANAGEIAAAIHRAEPHAVVNAAAFTAVDGAEDDPALAFRINAEAAREAAQAARDVGARFLHLSTDYVFGGTATDPYRENAPTDPIGVYGKSKLAGEEGVRDANPDHLIVRTAWVYSPFGNNFVRTMMRAARHRDVLRVVDDQYGSPTSALDLADGLLAVIDRWCDEPSASLGQTYHLAGTGQTSWCGFATDIMTQCAALDLPSARIEPIVTADWPTRAVRPAYSVLDSSRFVADFGYLMPSWQSSVTAVIHRLGADDH
ncbi:MAG: dTDP-4-dehydrorhamnose reductase [Pseudomonadota bacterium]|nr:dTDP-4-dehydrorhamnose reductase [Pseudomonadota bacterium]